MQWNCGLQHCGGVNCVIACLQVIHPFLYQQNSALLCKGSLQKRVFCLVAVEPAEDKTEARGATEKQTVDVARIKSLLQLSKEKYLTGAFKRRWSLTAFLGAGCFPLAVHHA